MVVLQEDRPQIVSIEYRQLIEDDPCVQSTIEEAYDINGLGVLTVSGVSGLAEVRQDVLRASAQFAALPRAVQQKYADPAGGSAGAGWSCGVEYLEDGQADEQKGSYFANPMYDVVTDDATLRQTYPGYLTPNIWPDEELPEFQKAFKAAGQLIIAVGLLLTRQCDKYVKSQNPKFEEGKLERVLKDSKVTKGRLLHYFPPKKSGSSGQAWCTQHTDHGSLTGLLSAMYFKGDKEVPNPDPQAGLYIRDRNGAAVKAGIPAGHIAYQMGEAMQVHSGGVLRATPHYVQSAEGPEAAGVARDTLAVFMQPNYDELMDLPHGAKAEQVGIGQWKESINFGEFSELTIKKYYKK